MIHIVSLLFWLIIVPFAMGLVPVRFIMPQKRNPVLVILAGYFLMWAVFEVICIPAVLWVEYHNFTVASRCFMAASLLTAVTGLVLWYRNGKAGKESLLFGTGKSFSVKEIKWDIRIEWLIFFALVGFQLYKAAFYASFDGDDAYYVVESLIAQQADVMYKILPYTGGSTGLDVRHVLAVFPMWVAFIADRSNIHATIVSHVVMPLVLIPLSYLVYYEISRRLFREKESRAVFMIALAFFQIFGNVSIYTNETFFLTRTWQGKAVVGSLVIPALLWVLLWIYDGTKKEKRADRGLWLLLVCVNMTAGICSSIAVFLVSILMAVMALVLMITERNFKVVLKLGLTCIPNVIYMGIYVVMGYSYLLR